MLKPGRWPVHDHQKGWMQSIWRRCYVSEWLLTRVRIFPLPDKRIRTCAFPCFPSSRGLMASFVWANTSLLFAFSGGKKLIPAWSWSNCSRRKSICSAQEKNAEEFIQSPSVPLSFYPNPRLSLSCQYCQQLAKISIKKRKDCDSNVPWGRLFNFMLQHTISIGGDLQDCRTDCSKLGTISHSA